jgi:hypothetical protein
MMSEEIPYEVIMFMEKFIDEINFNNNERFETIMQFKNIKNLN